jgi:hypothetical protein
MKYLFIILFISCSQAKKLNAYQVEYSRHFRKINDSVRVSEFGHTWVKRGDYYYLKP